MSNKATLQLLLSTKHDRNSNHLNTRLGCLESCLFFATEAAKKWLGANRIFRFACLPVGTWGWCSFLIAIKAVKTTDKSPQNWISLSVRTQIGWFFWKFQCLSWPFLLACMCVGLRRWRSRLPRAAIIEHSGLLLLLWCLPFAVYSIAELAFTQTLPTNLFNGSTVTLINNCSAKWAELFNLATLSFGSLPCKLQCSRWHHHGPIHAFLIPWMILLDKLFVTTFRLHRIARSSTAMFVDLLLACYLANTACAVVRSHWTSFLNSLFALFPLNFCC